MTAWRDIHQIININTTSLNVFDKYDKETQKSMCLTFEIVLHSSRSRNWETTLSQKKRRNCRNGLIIKHKEAYGSGCIISITLSDTWMFTRLNVCLFAFSCNAEEGKHFCRTQSFQMTRRWQYIWLGKVALMVLNKTTCWSSELSFTLFSIDFKINRSCCLLDHSLKKIIV